MFTPFYLKIYYNNLQISVISALNVSLLWDFSSTTNCYQHVRVSIFEIKSRKRNSQSWFKLSFFGLKLKKLSHSCFCSACQKKLVYCPTGRPVPSPFSSHKTTGGQQFKWYTQAWAHACTHTYTQCGMKFWHKLSTVRFYI